MIERRMESRYLCADIVRICWQQNGHQEQHSVDGVLEDIASRGICVQLDEAIPAGTPVHVFLGEVDYAGHVEYCTYQEIGYFIGVVFDDAARWTTHIFQPQHLTDLRELVDRAD